MWDSSGHLDRACKVDDPVTGLAVSPDGKLLAVTVGRFGQHPHGAAALLDINTGEVLRQIQNSPWPVETASFSADSRRLLTGGQDNTARIWDVSSGKELGTFVHEHPVMTVAIAPDGQHVATGSTDADSAARVWDGTTGRELVRAAP